MIKTIEQIVFGKSKFNNEKLLNYGFKQYDDSFKFEKNLSIDNMMLILEIQSNNVINSKVIDLDVNEEYLNYKFNNKLGEYAYKIKEEVINILEDIKENCSIETNYRFDQSNRIDSYICKAYKVKPEFPFKSNPSSGVYRHLENRKWFGLIMNIDKRKLGFKSSDEIEIINLKITPQIIEEKLKSIGYFKAYHMNKKSWISVSLDDSLSDEEIIRLIDLSFGLTKN